MAADDPSYAYTVEPNPVVIPAGGDLPQGVTIHNVRLTSQTWRGAGDYQVEANGGAVWNHWLQVAVPDQVLSTTGLIVVDGGSNGGGPPAPLDLTPEIAALSGTVTAVLLQVPNQPLVFAGEEGLRSRSEDSIIAYTFDQFMNSHEASGGNPDETWPLLLPMVKSVVRAMDTIQAMDEAPPVSDFVVTGASKRGWTTWLTGAVDARVRAIAPLVIDVLNMDNQMEHQFSAYGYWAPAIYDYAQNRVFDRFGGVAGEALLSIVDPFQYRSRYADMPKFIMNSTGDQFFLPDSSQWYLPVMPGETRLNYVPNTDHGLGGLSGISDGSPAVSALVSWYLGLAAGVPRPSLAWEVTASNSFIVETDRTPERMLLWQSDVVSNRDFRRDKSVGWASSPMREVNGRYVAELATPSEGYSAFFAQAQFSNPAIPPGADLPFTFTTPVTVLPRTPEGGNIYPSFAEQRFDADGVPLIVVHGTPREMGQQLGRAMKDEMAAFLPAFLAAVQRANPSLTNAALDAAWDAIRASADPGLAAARVAEELEGIAQGSGVSFVTLRRANMAAALDSVTGHAAAATRSATVRGETYQGHALLWNPELGLQENPCVVLYVPAPGHGFPHANVGFTGLISAFAGVNLGGIGASLVGAADQEGDPAPSEYTMELGGSFARALLYDAASSAEAADLLANTGMERRQHFVVGDGRNLRQVVKAQIDGPAGSCQVWRDNDAGDPYAPDVLADVVYHVADVPGAAQAAFDSLSEAHGSIDAQAMAAVLDAINASGTAQESGAKVIYGADDRMDYYEVADPQLQAYADSVCALVYDSSLTPIGGGRFGMSTANHGDARNLCPGEPFADQPEAAFCTGFMVGDDLIVTAGHCIESVADLSYTRFVFGYRMDNAATPVTEFDASQVYTGVELVAQRLDDIHDYAVVRVDRPIAAPGASPLPIRREGLIGANARVGLIGHPTGLPVKIAFGNNTRVVSNSNPGYFNATVDAYGGNSGSPVFNQDTGLVEGILVFGATDFVSNGGCNVSNELPTTGVSGEGITKITNLVDFIPIPDAPEVDKANLLNVIFHSPMDELSLRVLVSYAPPGGSVPPDAYVEIELQDYLP